MKNFIIFFATSLALVALSGCEAGVDRQKPQQQIAPPPYTKPIPRITKDDKLKPVNYQFRD